MNLNNYHSRIKYDNFLRFKLSKKEHNYLARRVRREQHWNLGVQITNGACTLPSELWPVKRRNNAAHIVEFESKSWK